MHFIPKLTRQRISELPEGTPIRIGARVVIFDGCSIEPNYKVRTKPLCITSMRTASGNAISNGCYSSQARNLSNRNCVNTAPGSGTQRT